MHVESVAAVDVFDEKLRAILQVICNVYSLLSEPTIKKWLTGLAANSILFCCHFTSKDRYKQVRFQQSHNQGVRQLLLTVSWDLCA